MHKFQKVWKNIIFLDYVFSLNDSERALIWKKQDDAKRWASRSSIVTRKKVTNCSHVKINEAISVSGHSPMCGGGVRAYAIGAFSLFFPCGLCGDLRVSEFFKFSRLLNPPRKRKTSIIVTQPVFVKKKEEEIKKTLWKGLRKIFSESALTVMIFTRVNWFFFFPLRLMHFRKYLLPERRSLRENRGIEIFFIRASLYHHRLFFYRSLLLSTED